MDSYEEALADLGRRARALRLLREVSQSEVARRAGIGETTLKRFERTGRASIENVLRIAMVLGVDAAFAELFRLPKYRTLDEALAQTAAPTRQRARRRR